MLSFSRDPKGYIQDLLRSQSRDLKVKGSPGALDGRQAYREGSERCPPGGWRASGADPAAASQVMTDVAGNPEEERRAEFYHQPWSQEAVSRYFYCKVGRARAPQPPSLREGTPRLGGALPAPRGSSEAGGGGRPVTHRRHGHPAPALAPHRSSSAGRSWSSRWSCATPRGPVREHAGPPGAAPVPRGSAVTPLPPACLPRGEAGNWIKGHSSDGSCVVIGNREGGGRGRQWAPREHSPGPSLRFFLLVFPRPKKHFGRRHF